ncbi:MAG: NVEALA domain-containing protein [Dysgonamonadaceae bacterium]|jgi:hypothetical protein|nr:NVEALA domain-containing protein [Dysgonamonadaceae bacterium]
MKKIKQSSIFKILGFTFALVFVVGLAAYNATIALNTDRSSDEVSLANVEALADGESSWECKCSCSGGGEVTCSSDDCKVLKYSSGVCYGVSCGGTSKGC